MLIEDIKKVIPSKLDENAKKVYEKLKDKTNNFDPEFLIVYQNLEEAVQEFVDVVKEKYPDAIRIVKKRQPKETPPVPETDNKEVIEAMKDYNLSQEKAERLIKLRHEASEARKESLDKMLDTLRKSDFYDERSTSKTAIDKNRSRDLGKDTNRGSITFKDEIRMTGRPFKRISKNGKTYYEYRLNRRDIDHKIRLAKGGLAEHGYSGKSPKEVWNNWSAEQRRHFLDDHNVIYGKDNLLKVSQYRLDELPIDLYKSIESVLKKHLREGQYSKGGSVDVYNLRKGDKVRTRNGKIETIIKKTGSGSYETIESEYTHSPESLEFVSRPTRRMAKGGGVSIPNAEKMFHLPYELAVYVPSTKDVDKNITATELRARVKEVEKYLAEIFGGFTSSEKVGGYLSSKSSVVTEKVIPVTSFATMEAFKAKKVTLVNKMSVWAKKWGQEAIGFEFEGDLYYVPQKFKEGGKLKATYIPKRDIKMLTTVWGNNIKGKDLIDGAYTKRKNIKSAPKMARTMFEEETFEFAKGGGVSSIEMKLWDEMTSNKRFHILDYQFPRRISKNKKEEYSMMKFNDLPSKIKSTIVIEEKFAKGGQVGQNLEFDYMGDPMKGEVLEVLESGDYIVRSGTRTILVQDMNVTNYGAMSKNRFGFYKKGGKVKKPMVVRYYFEDDGYEYGKGGHVDEEIDLFEDYENIPDNVQAILEKHEDSFETGNYKGLEKALKELNKIGYTFDYYLDGQAYNLRPIGSKGKHD
jgi:hypothetical protein